MGWERVLHAAVTRGSSGTRRPRFAQGTPRQAHFGAMPSVFM